MKDKRMNLKGDLQLQKKLQIIQKNISPVTIFTLGLHEDGQYDILKVEAAHIDRLIEEDDEEEGIVPSKISLKGGIERSVPSYIG